MKRNNGLLISNLPAIAFNARRILPRRWDLSQHRCSRSLAYRIANRSLGGYLLPEQRRQSLCMNLFLSGAVHAVGQQTIEFNSKAKPETSHRPRCGRRIRQCANINITESWVPAGFFQGGANPEWSMVEGLICLVFTCGTPKSDVVFHSVEKYLAVFLYQTLCNVHGQCFAKHWKAKSRGVQMHHLARACGRSCTE